MQFTISDVIYKTFGGDVTCDFSNNLVPAYKEDYANLWGVGGKDHARSSGIRITMTDTKQKVNDPRTGAEKSLTVRAQIPPYVFEQMLEICKKNIGATETGMSWLSFIANEISVRLRAFLYGAQQPNMDGQQIIPIRPYSDWEYFQPRCVKDPNGGKIGDVTTLSIKRTHLYNGELSRYPWLFTISNFKAEVYESRTGGVNYNSKSVVESTKRSASIKLSDQTVWECCSKVLNFIHVWEQVVCVPLMAEGLTVRDRERQTAAAEREQSNGQPQGNPQWQQNPAPSGQQQVQQRPAPAQGPVQQPPQQSGYGQSYGQQYPPQQAPMQGVQQPMQPTAAPAQPQNNQYVRNYSPNEPLFPKK